MHLKLIASIYRMHAISSTNFGEHGRNFMVNLNVKCMNHCTPDFLASLYSVINIFIPFIFSLQLFMTRQFLVCFFFFLCGWSYFGSLLKYGFMIISILCIAVIWISLFHHINVNLFFPCFEFVTVSVCVSSLLPVNLLLHFHWIWFS